MDDMDPTAAIDASMRDSANSQLIITLDLGLLYVTSCLAQLIPTSSTSTDTQPQNVKICSKALGSGLKCYHYRLSGALCEQQTNKSMREKHPDFINTLSAFLFTPRTEEQHKELKRSLSRCKETCNMRDDVVKFLHSQLPAGTFGYMDGGITGDRFVGFVRSGMMTVGLHVDQIPPEVSTVSKGKPMRWKDIDPDKQTGLEELTDCLTPRIDQLIESCSQWLRVVRTPHPVVFLIRCCTKFSQRVYQSIAKQPTFPSAIVDEMERFVQHAEATTRVDRICAVPGALTNEYDDFFGHYLTFVYELGKNVSEEENKRFLGSSCIPLYRLLVRLITLHEPAQLLDSVRFKPDPTATESIWVQHGSKPIRRMAKTGPQSQYTEVGMITMLYVLANKLWNLASRASTPEELRRDIVFGRLITAAEDRQVGDAIPLDPRVAEWRLSKEDPPTTLEGLEEEVRTTLRQDNLTHEMLGFMEDMDQIERIVTYDFGLLTKALDTLVQLANTKICMYSECAKRQEQGQQFQRCLGCSLFHYCSQKCLLQAWREGECSHDWICKKIKALHDLWKDLLPANQRKRATPLELYRRLVEAKGELRQEGILDRLGRVGLEVFEQEILGVVPGHGRSTPKAGSSKGSSTATLSASAKHLEGTTALAMISEGRIAQTAVARFLVKNDFAHEMMRFSDSTVATKGDEKFTEVSIVAGVIGLSCKLMDMVDETRKNSKRAK